MQSEKINSYLNRFVTKIYDPRYKGGDKNYTKHNIWENYGTVSHDVAPHPEINEIRQSNFMVVKNAVQISPLTAEKSKILYISIAMLNYLSPITTMRENKCPISDNGKNREGIIDKKW